MKRNDRKRTWYRILRVVLTVTLLYCCMVPQSLYAAEEEQEKIKQQSPAITTDKEVAPTTLTVTLQDEDGAPIPGISMSAISADFTGKEKDRATTDQDGKAVFKKLRSGTYYFFANINSLRKHDGYGMQAMIRAFKSSRSYYISESRKFDLSENVESTFVIKRGAYIMFETYLQVVRSEKIILACKKLGVEQIIPISTIDYAQIYLPMHQMFQIITIKDQDFDSWILEIFTHERMRIELL